LNLWRPAIQRFDGLSKSRRLPKSHQRKLADRSILAYARQDLFGKGLFSARAVFVSVLGSGAKYIEQLCEEGLRSSQLLPSLSEVKNWKLQLYFSKDKVILAIIHLTRRCPERIKM